MDQTVDADSIDRNDALAASRYTRADDRPEPERLVGSTGWSLTTVSRLAIAFMGAGLPRCDAVA